MNQQRTQHEAVWLMGLLVHRDGIDEPLIGSTTGSCTIDGPWDDCDMEQDCREHVARMNDWRPDQIEVVSFSYVVLPVSPSESPAA